MKLDGCMNRLRLLWPMAPGAFVLITYGASFLAGRVAGPEVRTQCYFSLVRTWLAHWPFQPGKYIPTALYPTIEPAAKAWIQLLSLLILFHLPMRDRTLFPVMETACKSVHLQLRESLTAGRLQQD